MSEADAQHSKGMSAADLSASLGLKPAGPAMVSTLKKPVFFVGFMGAGKTSVSRKLARSLGLTVLDMDSYIERQQDKKVAQIFAEAGEEGFRAIETETLRELAGREPMLIGCGGGVVLAEENRRILKESGVVVFLNVTAQEARKRISDLSTRPLFNDVEEAQKRNEDRLPLYLEVADITVSTAGKGVNVIAREVRKALEQEGVLCVRQK
ncbi:MAG: shikimate kinase [Coriobacteriia bacterium]|nr:shikimate kinase [Coriobacteriia bacterium]